MSLQTDPNKPAFVSSDSILSEPFVYLPRVTFGPKRWQLPNPGSEVLGSSANELRSDKCTLVNPEKLKAAAARLSQIGKAFFAATVILFGGASLTFGLVASKLELRNGDDIRTKGHSLVKPRLEMTREQLSPIRTWAEDTSKKWHLERDENFKDKPLVKELSRACLFVFSSQGRKNNNKIFINFFKKI